MRKRMFLKLAAIVLTMGMTINIAPVMNVLAVPDEGDNNEVVEDITEADSSDDDDEDDDDHSSSSGDSPDEASDDEKDDAVNRLSRYYHNLILVNGEDLTAEQQKKLKEICDSGRNAIAGNNDLRNSQLSDIESDTKKDMDDYVAVCLKKLPQTTVEYLAVGNVYDIPIASHGQVMNLVLPILNLGTEAITNVIVTPVVSGNVKEFPFQISRGGFTQEIPIIPGSVNMEQAMAQRAELMWAFALRDDVLDGYYKIEFNLVYQRNGVAESATLTTFVKCNGAPGAGSVEDGDSGKFSTPRIIVTGFSTDPVDVYAGSTFLLKINVKNASQHTAVSNIQFDLRAAEEGKDNDTLYYSFLPTSGSNTIYVQELPAGSERELEIEMSAKADLVQKPYALEMSMKYEDDEYNPYESTTSISVPVKQMSRVEYSTAEVVPEVITVGSQSNIMFSVYNTGKTILYNVKVSFDDPAVSGGDAYVGKLESGSTGNVDVMVTGEAAGGGDGIKGVISYENDAGDVSTMDFTVPLTVEEDVMSSEMPDVSMEDMVPFEEMEDAKSGPPVKIIVISAVVVAAVIVAVVIIIKKKKKKEKEEEI